MTLTVIFTVTPETGDSSFDVVLKGREAWAMRQLIRMGRKGCTTADNPAPRWSAYVYQIRNAGIKVKTIFEYHKGPFPGPRARYVLADNVHEAKTIAHG